MKANDEKNAGLIKQFPFLDAVIDFSQQLEPFCPKDAGHQDNLTIKVQKADGDILWRKANNTGLCGENSFLFDMRADRKGQIMKQGEYVFATDDVKMLNDLAWPLNDEQARGEEARYAWWVLWQTHHQSTGTLSDPFPDGKVTHLVWLTIGAWHEDTKNDEYPGSRFGKLTERNLYITVYTKPDCGFRKLEEDSWMGNHLVLDSRTQIKAIVQHNADVLNLYGRLDELCTLFQDEVYFSGMKEAFSAFKGRGASGIFGSSKVLCASMCGYDRVMLDNGNCWVTFQLRPEARMLYVLGMCGTLPQIRALVKGVVRMWTGQPDCRSNFKADDEVSVV